MAKSMASINCCITYCMSNLASSVHGNLYSIFYFGSSSVGIVSRSRHCCLLVMVLAMCIVNKSRVVYDVHIIIS